MTKQLEKNKKKQQDIDGQVFAWIPYNLHYKILSHDEIRKRDDSKLHSYIGFCKLLTNTKKNQPTTTKL